MPSFMLVSKFGRIFYFLSAKCLLFHISRILPTSFSFSTNFPHSLLLELLSCRFLIVSCFGKGTSYSKFVKYHVSWQYMQMLLNNLEKADVLKWSTCLASIYWPKYMNNVSMTFSAVKIFAKPFPRKDFSGFLYFYHFLAVVCGVFGVIVG